MTTNQPQTSKATQELDERPTVVVDRRVRPWVKSDSDRRTGRRAGDTVPYVDPWSHVGPRD